MTATKLTRLREESPLCKILVDEPQFLKPLETCLVKMKLKSNDEVLGKQVLICPIPSSDNARLFVVGESLTRVLPGNVVCCPVMNTHMNRRAKLKQHMILAEAYLVTTVYDSRDEMDPLQGKIMSMRFDETTNGESGAHVDPEAPVDSADFNCTINNLLPGISNSDEFRSSSDEFLSCSECPLDDFSEFERDKITDPELLKEIPKLDLSEVEKTWGPEVCKKLENLMDEYESLFMKHKADLGRCTLAEHGIELEPNVEPHREGARRMSPLKAAKANEEVRHLSALGMIQPSYSPWASGIVMVRKSQGK